MTKELISLENFSFSYGKKQVFDGLSLRFEPGYIYGVLGKNGTGKSTLFKNLTGLLKPCKGSIRTLGCNPWQRSPGLLSRIFLLPEEFHVPPIRIGEFARSLAPFYPDFDFLLLEELLKDFEIPADRAMNAMSLGQKKKCLISLSLAVNTPLLLLDEPTNGLDILSKTQFKQILRRLSQNQPRSILISTHQVKDIQDVINRVTVLDSGRILFDEPVEAILKRVRFGSGSEVPAGAVYAEPSARGFDFILPGEAGQTGSLDMELLYKLVMLDPEMAGKVFSPNPPGANP